MKVLFQQLVSPEQKQLLDLINAKGGINALRSKDQILLDLEKAVSKESSPLSVEEIRTGQANPGDSNMEIKKLREDISEDPNAAAENNWDVFSRKFELQKDQIIDELNDLKRVARRESDRVIEELKGKAHERIRDKVGLSYSPLCSVYSRCLAFSLVDP